MEGSSPCMPQPIWADRMASHIASVGVVITSERQSITFMARRTTGGGRGNSNQSRRFRCVGQGHSCSTFARGLYIGSTSYPCHRFTRCTMALLACLIVGFLMLLAN